jgi:hypothetical protein
MGQFQISNHTAGLHAAKQPGLQGRCHIQFYWFVTPEVETVGQRPYKYINDKKAINIRDQLMSPALYEAVISVL